MGSVAWVVWLTSLLISGFKVVSKEDCNSNIRYYVIIRRQFQIFMFGYSTFSQSTSYIQEIYSLSCKSAMRPNNEIKPF
jgi:hypothetical protein